MSDQFEFTHRRQEVLVAVRGPGASGVASSLFGDLPQAGRLEYRRWETGREPAAVCWSPPDQLELRVASGDLDRLVARLNRLNGPPSRFADRVRQLIARLEAWSYSDSDSGSGPAESMAGELGVLAEEAPTAGIRAAIAQARDALDDGLPAEVIAATLGSVLQEVERSAPGQPSGLEPSASG
jgi:hypothetical protein